MIAVLLPTYNQARFLPAALEGLAKQTYRNFEVIACNDGSTDETKQILKSHGICTANLHKNGGTAAAINTASLCMDDNTQFVTWVSSDNVMHPDWLKTLARQFVEEPNLGAVYSAYRRVEHGIDGHATKVVLPPYRPDQLIESDACYFGPSFLVRREVWQEHRGSVSHDYDWWARVEEACWVRGLGLKSVPQVLCDYHCGDWNTARRHPEKYDAPKWRAAAQKRREFKRNWLGNLVAAWVRPDDEVLDLGCGVMPATGGRLACKRHVGVDSFEQYLEVVGPPTVLGRLPHVTQVFADGSFDVVLMLDVIEHLGLNHAHALLNEAERIARREVIIFTPDGFVPQSGYAAWGMGDNPDQAHRCGFTFDELTGMGYDCTRYPNGSEQGGAIMSVFGVKTA